MSKYTAILIYFLFIASCVSEQGNSFRLNKQLRAPETIIIKSYINYLNTFRNSGIPILPLQDKVDHNNRSIISRSIRTDKDLLYYPATAWQIYALEGDSSWKNLAESFFEIDQMPLVSYDPGNGELIKNAFLTPYLITGDRRYSKLLIESLNQQISSSGTKIESADNSESGVGFGIEKLLENELLLFASRETGDPIYRELALFQSEYIYHFYFQNNSFNEVFYGLANWKELPGIKLLEGLNSFDFYRLSMSFYGFTYLSNELGDERYKAMAMRLAQLFNRIFEEDEQLIWDNLDLISKTFVNLAMSRLPQGDDETNKETSEAILNSILADLELWPDPEDQQYSFRMYYYLFECINKD